MRRIARLGGLASGETRHKKKVAKVLEIPPAPAEMLKRPNRSGGSHDKDCAVRTVATSTARSGERARSARMSDLRTAG
jgi:hypothetical protein